MGSRAEVSGVWELWPGKTTSSWAIDSTTTHAPLKKSQGAACMGITSGRKAARLTSTIGGCGHRGLGGADAALGFERRQSGWQDRYGTLALTVAQHKQCVVRPRALVYPHLISRGLGSAAVSWGVDGDPRGRGRNNHFDCIRRKPNVADVDRLQPAGGPSH